MSDAEVVALRQQVAVLQAQIAAMTKDMESIKPWRELQRENEELRKELQQARHDLMVRETAKDEEIAALKAKHSTALESAEICIWAKGKQLDVVHDVPPIQAVGVILDKQFFPTMSMDDLHDGNVYYTPTAAIEDFKRRAIEAAVYVVEVEDELIVKNAIAALPLIEEK